MPAARISCAAAWTSARVANAPAAHSPRPGIARREEPPVICTSAPPRPSFCSSAAMPVDRNTNACCGDRHRPGVERIEIRARQLAASKRAAPVARLAVTALITASTEPNLLATLRECVAQRLRVRRVGGQRERTALIDASERVLAAGDAGGVPPELDEVIDDRATEVAGAEYDRGLRHRQRVRVRGGSASLCTPASSRSSSAPSCSTSSSLSWERSSRSWRRATSRRRSKSSNPSSVSSTRCTRRLLSSRQRRTSPLRSSAFR